jgi:hypothetical protein
MASANGNQIPNVQDADPGILQAFASIALGDRGSADRAKYAHPPSPDNPSLSLLREQCHALAVSDATVDVLVKNGIDSLLALQVLQHGDLATLGLPLGQLRLLEAFVSALRGAPIPGVPAGDAVTSRDSQGVGGGGGMHNVVYADVPPTSMQAAGAAQSETTDVVLNAASRPSSTPLVTSTSDTFQGPPADHDITNHALTSSAVHITSSNFTRFELELAQMLVILPVGNMAVWSGNNIGAV